MELWTMVNESYNLYRSRLKSFVKKHDELKKFIVGFRQKSQCLLIFRIKKHISGKNNKTIYKNAILKRVFFDIVGNNNVIIIQERCRLGKVKFYIRGNNNKIVLGKGVDFVSGTFWTTCDNAHIEVGENTTVQADVGLQISENDLKIIVGKDCMFSSNISVWTQDWHPIFDMDGNKINMGKNVIIMDHVWIGYDTKILKGVTIGKNNIVGANSVVTKSFTDENIVIAGNPAKLVKRNVQWASK
jgi:acetyltransferase-like isoleucine patch superfamily enzyme